jgi:acetyltransferase-like isoleucine patch superfamily enzyme
MFNFFKKVKTLIGSCLLFPSTMINWRYLPLPKVLRETPEHIRRFALNTMGAEIPHDSYVRYGCHITFPQYLIMGNRSKIGPNCFLFLYATFSIGNDVEIGSGLTVHTADHSFSNPSLPLCKQGAIYRQVTVMDNVYIGSNVTLLAGITIKSNTVIGAGALVTKDLAGGMVYAGVPAKPVRTLSSR